MTIQELETKIIKYANDYYSGSPSCSDEEFDGLIEYLKGANPSSKVLTQVGWGYNPLEYGGEKENHLYGLVTGIDKKPYAIDEIPEQFKNSIFSISAKLDGLSIVCYFNNGKFIKAITRGNGLLGINRTDKIKVILDNELNIPTNFDFTGAIRGEIIITNENWEKMINDNMAGENQRNTASGIISRDDILNDINYVNVIFYKVIGYQDNNSKYNNIYKNDILNKKYDFDFLKLFIKENYIVDYIESDTINKFDLIQENLDKLYDKYKELYPCDGLVITKLNRKQQRIDNKFVNNYAIINDEIAYKFRGEMVEAIVDGIEWKLSKSGLYKPRIRLEPVVLSGATIQYATGFNAKYIKDNKIGKGTKVKLVRSGEVIPSILEVLDNFDENVENELNNTTCPECGNVLEWSGVDLKCNNKECSNKDYQNLRIWVNNIAQVDGISEKLIFGFFEELGIDSLEKLYNYKYDDLEFTGEAKNTHKGKFNLVLNKLFNENIDLNKLLVGLNIQMLGKKSADKLAGDRKFVEALPEMIQNNFKNISNDIKEHVKNLVGEVFSQTMFNDENIKKLQHIKYVVGRIAVHVVDNENNDEKIPVVITGKLSIPRKDFESYLNKNGYEVKNNITKTIKYLITDNPNSKSSKNLKADELGIEKITESQIRDIIEKEKGDR